MTSKIEVFNLGLLAQGASARVQDEYPAEDSVEAQAMTVNYEPARRFVLRDHDWNFARTRLALSLLGDGDATAFGWTYKYSFPNNCLKVLEIQKDTPDADPVPYDLGFDYETEKRVLYTDKENAVLIFTFDLKDVSIFDASCVIGLSRYLAYLSAPKLMGLHGKNLEALYNTYLSTSAAAKATNLQEGQPKEERDASAIRARE